MVAMRSALRGDQKAEITDVLVYLDIVSFSSRSFDRDSPATDDAYKFLSKLA